jgi:hypothetical protein
MNKKTVLWVDQDLDGTFKRMGGSKLSMNTFCSSCFSVCDRKNLIAKTKMHPDFQLCKPLDIKFFILSHKGKEKKYDCDATMSEG